MANLKFIIKLFITLLLTTNVQAWGSLGHRTVAYLSTLYFQPETQKYVNTLLNGQDISEAALFPDKVRHIPSFAYSASWHYIDVKDDPPKSCGINITRDCDLIHGGCVVSAISNHTTRVRDVEGLPKFYRGQSLRFVLHFFGDVHQPLHTEAEERGGNEILVQFDGKKTNLHSVWDTFIPNKRVIELGGGEENNVDELESAMLWALELFNKSKNGMIEDEKCELGTEGKCSLGWASEANKWVCDYVFKDELPDDLGEEYYQGAVSVVDELIGKAGRRLAAWINMAAAEEKTMIEKELLTTQYEL